MSQDLSDHENTNAPFKLEWFWPLPDFPFDKFVERMLARFEQVCDFIEKAEQNWKLVI